METQQTTQPPAPRMLSMEERNDLRKLVLGGGSLTIEQAREVMATLRDGQAGAILSAGEAKPKKERKKKGISDEELDSQLDSLLDL